MTQNWFAYTGQGMDYPPYVSIVSNDVSNVFVTVRSHPREIKGEGYTVGVDIPREAFLLEAIRMGINAAVELCHARSAAAGWWKDPKTGEDFGDDVLPYVIGTKMMLSVSEISEAMEGHRKGLMDDKLVERPMTEVEFGDAIIRLADLAGRLGYSDLGGAVVEKMQFNAVRPDHKIENRVKEGGKSY